MHETVFVSDTTEVQEIPSEILLFFSIANGPLFYGALFNWSELSSFPACMPDHRAA